MKIVGKAVQILKDINQSQGAKDLTSWAAHGATESANLLIHGHAAPMYTQGGSSPEQGSPYGPQETEADKHNREAEARDAKLDRASQGMKSRMVNPEQHQEQERSR